MNKTDFNEFLSNCLTNLQEVQRKRIENNLSGSFSSEQLVAQIIGECDNSIVDYLKAYNKWLFDNFNISPKQN